MNQTELLKEEKLIALAKPPKDLADLTSRFFLGEKTFLPNLKTLQCNAYALRSDIDFFLILRNYFKKASTKKAEKIIELLENEGLLESSFCDTVQRQVHYPVYDDEDTDIDDDPDEYSKRVRKVLKEAKIKNLKVKL